MESPSDLPSEDNDVSATRMWQLWRPFVGIHRWYFSPGCPPPLRNLDGWTGCLHASVFCAVIGLLAATMAIVLSSFVPDRYFFLGPLVLGFVYGMLVVYPLLRWMDRSVFWAVTGIGVCLASYSTCLFSVFVLAPIFSQWLGHGDLYLIALFLVIYGTPAIILAMFVSGRHWKNPWMILMVFLAALVHAITLAVQSQLVRFWPAAIRGNRICHTIIMGLPLIWFLAFLAVVLGMRLWPSMRNRNHSPTESTRSLNPP